ncbi:MAG: sulfotransferase, partial [gamma proteobacterium symbiont of Bathyaustriella thionipta]|nr:sulfotransferase [gamma proteobacterium symbiont of Bathyaustriella thionipta]
SENDLSKENYLSLRYEDVVSDPTHYFKQIIAFSGLNLEPSFTQALDDYHFTSHRFKSYEQDLNRAQLDELNNSLGEVLQQYHYD